MVEKMKVPQKKDLAWPLHDMLSHKHVTIHDTTILHPSLSPCEHVCLNVSHHISMLHHPKRYFLGVKMGMYF